MSEEWLMESELRMLSPTVSQTSMLGLLYHQCLCRVEDGSWLGM